MKFKSAMVTQASGSIGGLTAAHNRGGLYMRARSIPVNTNTAFQQAVRNAMTTATGLWTTSLSSSQREAWETYGLAVPLPNPLGDDIPQSGIAAFVRCNVPRIQNGLDPVLDGPTTFSLGGFTDPDNFSSSASTQLLAFAFDTGDAWVDEDGAALLVQVSRPQNPSINYFDGPYRITDPILGDNASPPSSPTTVPLPFPVAAGQKIFVRMRVTRADGRLSGTFRGSVNVAV